MLEFQENTQFIDFSLFNALVVKKCYNIYLMQQIDKKKFVEMLQHFSDPSKSKKLFKKAQGLYLMRSFKITNISCEEAEQSYERLFNKYESNELQVITNDWHKNERKLFIWYLICYCEEKKLSIQDITDKEWAQMVPIFFNKSPLFLKFQGLSILKNTKRHNWTPQDDQLLKKYVGQIGSNQWNVISKTIFFEQERGRFISPKQCRQRWFNHICTEINKGQWTKQQDLQILKLNLELGKKWSAIARLIGTHRTEHMVKNRYNSIINKIRRKKVQNQQSLTKKAISQLDKGQQSISQIQQQKTKNHKKNAEITSKNPVKKQESKASTAVATVQRANSKQISRQNGEQYNVNDLPDGDLKDLKGFVNKRQKGFISFNAEEGLQGDGIVQNIGFSMTPSSVKAISPGFNHFYCNFGDYVNTFEKRRQDGSSLFSPAPGNFSPAANYVPSFSPSMDMHMLLNSNKDIHNRSIQYPSFPSELSCEYKNILNKKQGKQFQQ